MKITAEKYYEKKIEFYKILAFTLVSVGFLILVFGIIVLIVDLKNLSVQTTLLSRLSDLGQFFGGTVAAFWALAGLIFIYIGFLHQQYELVLQRMKESVEKKQKEIDNEKEKVSEFNNEIIALKTEYKESIKSFEFRDYKGLTALNKLFVTLKNKFREDIKEPFDVTNSKLTEEQYNINHHRYYMQVRSLIESHLNEHLELRKCLRVLAKIFEEIVNSDLYDDKDKKVLLKFFYEELVTVEKLYFFYYMWSKEGFKFKKAYKVLKVYESLNEDLDKVLARHDVATFLMPS
jgi:hypothetical protein